MRRAFSGSIEADTGDAYDTGEDEPVEGSALDEKCPADCEDCAGGTKRQEGVSDETL